MKTLSYISATLKGAAAQMDDRDRAAALDCFEHWKSQWKRTQSGEPQSVAYTVHCLIDERMQYMLATSKHAPQVKCRKGCAACCHMSIDIFPQEAVLLRMLAQHEGIEIDEARLARQATKDVLTWGELAPEDRACVFLAEDRSCRIHEHRPGACRKYLVKTDPELCDLHKHPGANVGVVFELQAEIAHSAAMTVFGSGSMAAMLLKHQPED